MKFSKHPPTYTHCSLPLKIFIQTCCPRLDPIIFDDSRFYTHTLFLDTHNGYYGAKPLIMCYLTYSLTLTSICSSSLVNSTLQKFVNCILTSLSNSTVLTSDYRTSTSPT